MGKKAIEVTSMPHCCGAIVLSNFWKNADPRTEVWDNRLGDLSTEPALLSKYNKDQGYETQEEYHVRVKTDLKKYIESFTDAKSYILVTLNDDEKNLVEEILLSFGFTVLVPRTNNPGGTYITLYIRHLLKEENR